MALVPLACPQCVGTTTMPGASLDVAVVAGTQAWATCRWTCEHCRRSVVICLTDHEFRTVQAWGARPRNVDRPANDGKDQARILQSLGVMFEEEVWRACAEIERDLKTCPRSP